MASAHTTSLTFRCPKQVTWPSPHPEVEDIRPGAGAGVCTEGTRKAEHGKSREQFHPPQSHSAPRESQVFRQLGCMSEVTSLVWNAAGLLPSCVGNQSFYAQYVELLCERVPGELSPPGRGSWGSVSEAPHPPSSVLSTQINKPSPVCSRSGHRSESGEPLGPCSSASWRPSPRQNPVLLALTHHPGQCLLSEKFYSLQSTQETPR